MSKTRRPYKHMTQERYDTIKVVLKNVKANTKGINEVYKALGISSGTVSSIRHSESYQDYKDKQHAYRESIERKKANNVAEEQPFGNPAPTLAEILSRVTRIESKLDDIKEYADLERQVLNDVVNDDTAENTANLISNIKTKFNL